MFSTPEGRALAAEIAEYLTANPNKHDQNFFWYNPNKKPETRTTEKNFCGTTMCVAGATVYLAEGFKGVNKLIKAQVDDPWNDDLTWESYAADLLGLEQDEAQALFFTFNNQATLEAVKALAKGDKKTFDRVLEEAEDYADVD